MLSGCLFLFLRGSQAFPIAVIGVSASVDVGGNPVQVCRMKSPTPVEIGSLITRSPDIKGGSPRVAGTGVTVKRIAGWHSLGMTPEEIDND